MKDKKKFRSFTRVFSAPIRKMGKQLSKRTNRKFSNDDKADRTSKKIQVRDEEQGWIAPATTFETEDTLSPRSFDSLTTSDSTCILVPNKEEVGEDTITCSILDSSQQQNSDQFLDLEASVKESARTSVIFRTESNVESDNRNIECIGNILKNYEIQNAAPQMGFDDQKRTQGMKKEDSDDGNLTTEPEHKRKCMISLLSRIDTTEIIDEDNEIGSLVPVADISFFLDEDANDDFHCVGRLSTRTNEAPPIEIDIDSDSFGDATLSPQFEDKDDKLHIGDDDEVSSTSSHNSYLQAIESITASANSRVEEAIGKIEITTFEQEGHDDSFDQKIPMAISQMSTEKSYRTHLETHGDEAPESDEEEECFRVSFNPSNEMLLNAMKDASVKARMDIERATALALSKIDQAKSRETSDVARVSVKNTPNRVLGLFLVLFFSLNAFQFLTETRFRSNSNVMKNNVQMQSHNDVEIYHPADLSTWGEKQTVVDPDNKTQVVVNDEHVYNVGCAFKIGCLALGNI